jgi:glycosyltransferase involved in cell wall biosynthesis
MSEPIRVLLMARSLDLGGSERQLAETALNLDRRRFEVHVGCFHPEGIRGKELRRAGVPILHLRVHSFGSPSALRAAWDLRTYIDRHDIHVVHTFDTPLNIFAALPAKLSHARVVLSSQRANRSLSGRYLRALRWTDRIVNGIVVNCEAMREHLTRDEHIPPARVHLCYNGIDPVAFSPAARPQRDEVIVGVVCALRPEKGLETLIDAFAVSARRRPCIRLLIVGSGPSEETLRSRVAALGIVSQARFEPATADVASALRNMDIFVLPSLSEALSNSLMEAQACGCATIASNVGGNPELVHPGETGLLFPPGDSAALAAHIERLVDDPRLRCAFSEAGSRRIRTEFTNEVAARRMADIYTAQLGSAAAR